MKIIKIQRIMLCLPLINLLIFHIWAIRQGVDCIRNFKFRRMLTAAGVVIVCALLDAILTKVFSMIFPNMLVYVKLLKLYIQGLLTGFICLFHQIQIDKKKAV